MIHLVVLTGLLTAAPSTATPVDPPQLAIPSLSTAGLDASLHDVLVEHVAQRLTLEGVKVTTPREIAAVIGFERQKQLLGCADESSCITEIAGALGVDAILLGGAAKVGGQVQLQLRAVSATDARTLASWSERVPREEDMFPGFTRGARAIAPELARGLGKVLSPDLAALAREEDASRRAGLRKAVLPVGLVGAVAVVAGGAGVALSRRDHAALTHPSTPLTLTEAARLRDRGSLLQTAGFSAVGVGAAALVGSGVLWFMGREPSVVPAVSASGQGAAVTLGGRF